ncbi:MAG: NAD(P)/FAD-dependent oxidoreductase [Acidobacteriota bacterium]
MNQSLYDVIIVGGGPAGLTCAIFLARYRRRVLVVDEGRPRNHATRGIHGFLGHHEIAPAELLARGRNEVTATGGELCGGRVTKIERSGDSFEVTTSERGLLRARRIVLAYGVRDTLPDIPDLQSYYGRSVHHCPDCDGYESRDQRIGVIGWDRKVVGLALELLQWSSDVVIFTHGHERNWNEEEHSKLLAEHINIEDGRIVALEGEDGAVSAAVLETGQSINVQRLFFTIDVARSCTLAEDLGCACDPEQTNLIVDEFRQTSIEGVWAAGDLVAGSQLAVTAAAGGAIAAIAINKTLLPPSRKVE